jgi:hypothetical protein
MPNVRDMPTRVRDSKSEVGGDNGLDFGPRTLDAAPVHILRCAISQVG